MESKIKKGKTMIKINEDAYITADKLCFELFTKQLVEKVISKGKGKTTGVKGEYLKGSTWSKSGEKVYEFIGGRYYSNLDNALNGYICEHLLSIAEKEEAIPLKDVIKEIQNLKHELVLQFHLITDKTIKP